jgi:hypothetical protein
MSVIDDSRTLLQDIVTPDLKAIATRLDALEKSVRQGFESVEKVAELRQELILNRLESERAANVARHELVMSKLDREIAELNTKYSLILTQIEREDVAAKERHESLLKSLDIDRRVELLESRRNSTSSQSERKAQHAKSA